MRTPATSSMPKPFEPMTRSSLKYMGVHSKRLGGSTPLTTSVPPVCRRRREVSTVSVLPIVS